MKKSRQQSKKRAKTIVALVIVAMTVLALAREVAIRLRTLSSLIVGAVLALAAAHALAQGSASSSTSRFISPTVVASWMSRTHGSATDTLLVLWRGSPGWFSKTGVAGGSSSWSSGGKGGEQQFFRSGELNFALEFSDERRVVKILGQEISLTETNVVLVDGVDSAPGPTVIGRRWIAPGPPLPPIVAGASEDPIAGIISRSPELIEYLQCGVTVPDPLMNTVADLVCRRMRGETITLPGLQPR